MFLVRVPIAIAFGLLARKAAERLTGATIGRMQGIEGDKSPEAKDLSVQLRWVLAAAIFEAIAFTVAKTIADRGAERVAMSLAGKPAPSKQLKK